MKRNSSFNQQTSIRNIGMMAHVDAGKTTATERILYYTGSHHLSGNVDDGNTRTDFLKQEQDRGITIQSAAISAFWEADKHSIQINLIDTPGHMDFTVEVERSLRVLDGAVALFCAVGGVEAQSRTVWAQADRYGVPRIAFVNKMDRQGAGFHAVVKQMRELLGANALPVQLPLGAEQDFCGLIDLVEEKAVRWEKQGKDYVISEGPVPPEYKEEVAHCRKELVEALALVDDDVLEAWAEGMPVPVARLHSALRKAVLSGELCPVLCGSAYHHIGIQPLLDAVANYLPAPEDCEFVVEGERVLGAEAHPAAALAFKIVTDKYVGKLCFVRVYDGTLRPGAKILNVRTGQASRISRIFRIDADKRREMDCAVAGEIVALTGIRDLRTGDTLADPALPRALESMCIPEPVIEIVLEAKKRGEAERLGQLLQRFAQEDPTLRIRTEQETGQLVVAGMGELHLEVMIDRLREESGMEVNSGMPQVGYREAITQVVQHRERFKMQRGGKGQFAEVEIEFLPLESGEGLVFENAIRGGAVPAEFIPSVEKGILVAMAEGVVGGHPVLSLRARLLDGRTHSEDSTAMAFERCARRAFRAAAAKAAPVLLEPLMRVEVDCPDGFTGVVISDLNRRHGRILELSGTNRMRKLIAEVPLARMFGYVMQLRGLTSGTGSFAMAFARYSQVRETNS